MRKEALETLPRKVIMSMENAVDKMRLNNADDKMRMIKCKCGKMWMIKFDCKRQMMKCG